MGTASVPNQKWGMAFSLRTRFPAGPAGRKAGLRPRLANATYFSQIQTEIVGQVSRPAPGVRARLLRISQLARPDQRSGANVDVCPTKTKWHWPRLAAPQLCTR
jgi:hypothetical protein